MPGEQRGRALPSARASGPTSRPPSKNHTPAGGTPKASGEEAPESTPDPNGAIEPWALLLGPPPLSSPPQPCSLQVAGSMARPPLARTPGSLPCGGPKVHVRPEPPRAEAPPAPEDLGFHRGFPDTTEGFASPDYGCARPLPPRAPPSGGHSPCEPGSYSDLGALGAQAWPHAAGDSFPGAAFGVPPTEPKSFPYPFTAPHGPSPKPFSEGAAGQPCAQGAPLFASPQTSGEWSEEVGSTDPTYPLPMPSGPAPPLCYPSQPGVLNTSQDLSGADPEAGAAPLAPSPFSGSRASFLEGLHGEPPNSLPQGQFPGPGSLDLPLVSPGHPPTGLPQLWGPATPSYPTGPPLGAPAAAAMVFLEDQPSPSPQLGLPWAPVLSPASSSTQQRGLNPPSFPPGTPEWPGSSQGALGAGRPGGERGALGASPGSSPQLCSYNRLKDPGASVLLLGPGQPQVSPQGPPLPQDVVATPSESPLPSPAAPTAGSSCSSLSPPSDSPANPSSEDSQLSGALGVPAYFQAPTHPQGSAPQLLEHYQPIPARACAFSDDTGDTQGAFGCLRTAPFPGETPCSEQHFLDQLGVLLTCRHCDRNYSSVAAFLGHRPYCSPGPARPQDTAPPQLPGSPTPPATPKAPADGVPGPFPLPGTGPSLLAEGKEETLSSGLLPATPFLPPVALDLDLEDAAKLDSLITEALHGLECQAHSPEIDSSFIDVFTDEENPAGAAPREPQAPQPRAGSPPACSRPQTRSRGPVPAGGTGPGPASQQRRGKRFKLPVQDRGLAAATAQRPGRGPRLRPRRKNSREQAPGSQAEPRKALRRRRRRRRARGHVWGKRAIHKIVEQKQRSQRAPGLRPQEPDVGSDDTEGPWPHLSCPREPCGEEVSRPQAGRKQPRPRKEARPEGGELSGPCSVPTLRPEAGGDAQGPATPLLTRDPAASPSHPWPGPPCMPTPEDPSQEPLHPEITGDTSQDTPEPLRKTLNVSTDTAGPLGSSGVPPGAPQPCTVSLNSSGLGGAPALVNGVSLGAPQSCSKPSSSHSHQGLSPSCASVSPQAGQGHPDWSRDTAGAPNTAGTDPGLGGPALAMGPDLLPGPPSGCLPGDGVPPGPPPSGLPPSQSPPSSPDLSCVPPQAMSPHPGVPGQGQSEPRLDIRKLVTEFEGQLETSWGAPGTPGRLGRAELDEAPRITPAPQSTFTEVSCSGPGPETATVSMKVAPESPQGEWGVTVPLSAISETGLPKAEVGQEGPPRDLQVLTLEVRGTGASSERPTADQVSRGRQGSGPELPCRQRVGRSPRPPQTYRHGLTPCGSPGALLAPDMTFGGVEALSQGTPLRASPQDGQEGFCPVPSPGRASLSLPQLCAVGREDTPGSGGPPVAADTYRPLELPGSCVDGGPGHCSTLTDAPGTAFATRDSSQLRPAMGLTQPHRAARPDEELVATHPASPIGSLKCPAQEEPLTAPSGGSQDLQHLPVSPQRAVCTPEPPPQISPHSPQQGLLLGRPPKNQACCPGSDPADWTEAHLGDKTGTPTGPRKENPRGSPLSRALSSGATTPTPERLDTVRPDPHASSGPASSDPPGHSAHIGPRAAQGSSTASSDTAVPTYDVLAPAATCPSAEHRPRAATLPHDAPTPQDSGVGPRPGRCKDEAAHTCDICSAAFRSRPGLSRHRAWRHGLRRVANPPLCTPTLPAPQPQDTPRKKSRTQPRKGKPRPGGKNSPEAPRPELGAGCAPSQELDSPRRRKPSLEKGSGLARHRPSGRQAEPRTHPSGGREAPSSPEPWAGETALQSGAQQPGAEPRPYVPPTRTSDPSTSDPATPPSARSPSCLLPGPEPGALSSQPPGRTVTGPGGTEAGPSRAAERLQSRKGVTGPQAKKHGGRRETGTSSYNRHPSRVARGPPQPPRSPPESLQTSVPKLKEVSPDAASLGLEAPMSLRGADHSFSQLFPPGTLPTQKRKPDACGKQKRRGRTKPLPTLDPHLERAGASDTGTSGHQPTDLCGSGSLSLSGGSFLLDGCGPWGPHPSLWAPEPPSTTPHTQNLTENIPELHRIPAAWGSPLGEPPSQDGGSPEPPSLEPEPYPSLLPAGSLDLQMLRVKMEVQDLCFLGSCEDSAELPRLSGLDLGTTADPPRPPTPGSPSPVWHSRAQMGAGKRSVCFQHLPGLDVHALGRSPMPPPTCYMCVERRFGSHQLLQEHLQEKHAQSQPGPWACGTCLREEADVWTYNAHLQDHALSSAHHGLVPGTPGWEDHDHVPHFLSSLMETVLRPHRGQADGTPSKALGPEPPGSESPRGRGSAQAGAPSTSPPGIPAAPWVPPAAAMHVGCRDESRDCHHCGKSFPKPFKLQRHLPVHSALRIFLCPRCPRVYLEHGALRAHLGAAHGAGAEREVPPTALFSCELCADVACASKRAFVCSACNFTFAKKDQLRRHLDKHRRRARPPAPFRRGRRPGPPRQNTPGREGASPSKRCRVAMPGSPPAPGLPHPLSPGADSLMALGDACPDPALSCLAMATNPTEEPGEPRRVPPRRPPAPPESLSAAPSKGSCKPAGSPQSSRGEVPSGGPRPPAQQASPLRPAPRGLGMEEKSGAEALPGTCRPPSAPSPCHEAPAKSQKPDPRCHPAPTAASEGPLIKPGCCRGLSKDRLGGTTTSKAPQIPAQHKRVRRSPPPVGSGPRHSRGAGGSRPQPASGRLQSEAASTPTKADCPGQNPTPDRSPSHTPAEGCPRGPRNMGEQGGPSSREAWKSSEERRKGQGPSVPDKPPRAPRKQATPCRVLPAKPRPGAQSGRTTRQVSEQGTLLFGDPRQRGLAKAFPHAGSLHGRPKRGRVGHTAAAPAPRPCLTAESQNHLLSQLFGPRLSCFKIPLKKGPSA